MGLPLCMCECVSVCVCVCVCVCVQYSPHGNFGAGTKHGEVSLVPKLCVYMTSGQRRDNFCISVCCLLLSILPRMQTTNELLECMAIGKTTYNGIPLKPIGNADNKLVTIHRRSSICTLMLLCLWIVT